VLTHALVVATGMLMVQDQVPQSQTPVSPPARRPHYPLSCRGGAQLVLDTMIPPSDTGKGVSLSLTFAASPTAAGAEGQGLQPSTCAWVDRPLNAAEPRQIRVTVHDTDSAPRLTVRDTGVYWSFLAYNSDSGHFTGVGHRHWDAASAPIPIGPLPQASVPPKGNSLRFNPRHLHWYFLAAAIGWVVIVGLPMLTLTGLWSGWRRLAGLYPDRNMDRGRSFRCSPVVMGMANYRGGVRLTPDHSHLHFSVWALLRPGHPPFSVPWSDITASRDEWPWFPFKGAPVIRLTLRRYRRLRILVQVSDGERMVAASGARLHLSEPATPVSAVPER
jgi:hypothetical protein